MFIWDFAAGSILDQIMDWLYGMLVGFLGEFFAMMNGMGAELFDLPWVEALVLFFSRLGWMLYAVGLVVAVFECAIEYQSGRGSIKDCALNAVKGFLAVSLFSTVPIALYREVVSLEGSLSGAIAGMGYRDGYQNLAEAAQGTIENLQPLALTAVVGVFCLILLGYAVFKVFFFQSEAGRDPFDPDCGGKPVYVRRPPRIYRWVYRLVQAGGGAVSDHFFAVVYFNCRIDGVSGAAVIGTGADALCRGNSAPCRALRHGTWYPRQADGQLLCGPACHYP